jgi:glycosyltransferase involved in cell wall biosynthesis
MIDRPFLTVGIPAYNNFETLIRAMDSVKDQTFKDLEILISDDCSKVDLKSSVEEWCSLNPEIKVRYFYQPNNLHIARNKQWLLDNAQGKFLAFLEHDDYLIDARFYKEIYENNCRQSDIKVYLGNAIYDSLQGHELFQKKRLPDFETTRYFQVYKPKGLLKYLLNGYFSSQLAISWSSIVVEVASAQRVDAFGVSYLLSNEWATKLRVFPHEEHMIFVSLIHENCCIAWTHSPVSYRAVTTTSFSANFKLFTNNEVYLNDSSFFNHVMALNKASTRVLKLLFLRKALQSGLRFNLPAARNYLARVEKSSVIVFIGLVYGKMLNPLLKPVIVLLNRVRRIHYLYVHHKRYLRGRIVDLLRNERDKENCP